MGLINTGPTLNAPWLNTFFHAGINGLEIDTWGQ